MKTQNYFAKCCLFGMGTLTAFSTYAGIINTGFDSNTDRIDDNWRLTGINNVVGLPATYTNPNAYLVTTPNGTFPFGPWIANDSVSKWVTYSDGLFVGVDATTRTFTYEQNFTSGNEISQIRWLSDNDSYVYLDNVLVGSRTGNGNNFSSWNSYVNLGLSAGSHVLRVDVVNAGISGPGNPTGLRFEAVPEPSTYVAAALLMIPAVVQFRRMRATGSK